jgi:hypothetical protein
MKTNQISGVWCPNDIIDRNKFQFVSRCLGLAYGRGVTAVEDDRYFFILDGDLFDIDLAQAISDQQRLDMAYGHFAYVLYDKLSDEITIGTDRFGYFPMYYALESGCLIFGTSLGAVKSRLKKRTPDYEAWEELLFFGEILGDKSTVKEIKRLSPGTRVNIKNRRIEFSTYWLPEVPPIVDADTYIRQNNELLGTAMALTGAKQKQKVVLLSGGEDSRRIAVGAVKQGLEVDFFTQESLYRGRYKVEVDRDLKLACQVAAVLRRPHFSEPIPGDQQFLADCQTRDVSLGFECIAHEWLLPLARGIEPGALVYDGIAGDITINGHYFKNFPQAAEVASDVHALTAMICGSGRAVWLDELARRTETSLADRVGTLLASYPASPHRLTYFYLLNHTRRKISCVAQLFSLYGHTTCYPFLYYPLFLQSLSVDPRLMRTRFFQRECMAAQAPEALSVPTTREDLGKEWLIPRGAIAQHQLDLMLAAATVSEEALELFPTLRFRYRTLRKLQGMSLAPLRKFGWFILPIARYSAFLDWLRQDE